MEISTSFTSTEQSVQTELTMDDIDQLLYQQKQLPRRGSLADQSCQTMANSSDKQVSFDPVMNSTTEENDNHTVPSPLFN